MKSKFDKLKWQREHRLKTGNKDCKKYEKTKNGFLMRIYRNMTARVSGMQKKKAHLYLGKSLLPKEAFYEWANSSENFHKLFAIWEKSNYERRLTPSVDRIDPCFGYLKHNMEWVTFSENCRRGGKSKNHS